MTVSNRFQWLRRDPNRRPWLVEYRSSKWFILVVCTMAVFTDIFLYALIVPVIPFALQARANIRLDQVQSWVSILIAVYGGALALFSPICGWLADRLSSRRVPLLVGLLALGGATIILNLGSSIAVLIVGRILQGLSAAVVWVVGLALLADSIESKEVNKMMGHMFFGLTMGYLLGPLLGGVVFAKAGYDWVFGMAYILIGVDVAMRLLIVEKRYARKWIDVGMENPAAPAPRVVGDEEKRQAEQRDEDDIKTLPDPEKEAISPVDVEPPNPIVPKQPTAEISATRSVRRKTKLPPVITLLGSRRMLTSLWATIVLAITMTQFDSVLPLHVRRVFGWGSTGAGIIFVPIVIPSFLAPLIGSAVDKYGGRWFATSGFLTFVPFEILLRVVTHDSLGQKVLLCALLLVIGFSMDLMISPIMGEFVHVVAGKERQRPGLFGENGAYAQAYGLFNFAWAVGSLIGPIWAGYVNEKAGWGTMTLSIGLLALSAAIPSAIWVGGSMFKQRRSRDVNDAKNHNTQATSNV